MVFLAGASFAVLLAGASLAVPERRLHTWVVPRAVRLCQKRSTAGVDDVAAVVNIAAVGSGGRNDVEAERQVVQHIGETPTEEVPGNRLWPLLGAARGERCERYATSTCS